MSGDMLRRLFRRRGGNADPTTRLNAAEAERIARAAAAGSPLANRLVLRGAWAGDGGIAWHFWVPARGSSLVVRVDDATGDVVVERSAGR